jgi:hypothetical protein
MAHLAFRMPANSNAIGGKKARKKPKAPQVIAPEVWVAIEKAVCAGMGYSQAARAFGIRSPHAIIMRSRRDKWPVPSRVEERARQLQDSLQRRLEVTEQRRNSNDETMENLAQSWAERGEQHRSLIYDMTHSALKKIAQSPPPLEDWSSIERADKAARRACGLEDSKETRNINVGMQLINQRLEIITADLPKEID